MIADAQRRDPGNALGELHRCRLRQEAEHEDRRQEQLEDGDAEGRVLNDVFVVDGPDHHGPAERQEQQDRQQGKKECEFL